MDQLSSKIDFRIEELQARIDGIDRRFEGPRVIAFPAILATLEQPSLPLAPPPPDSAFQQPSSSLPTGGEFGDIIRDAGSQYGVDPLLIQAVIHQESKENPNARSEAGAKGLMQLMPDTARTLGVNDPYDPRQNILGGTRYLKGLLEQFGGNTSLALAAYNAGPNAVRRSGWRVPSYGETQRYVRNILEHYWQLRNHNQAASFPGDVK